MKSQATHRDIYMVQLEEYIDGSRIKRTVRMVPELDYSDSRVEDKLKKKIDEGLIDFKSVQELKTYGDYVQALLTYVYDQPDFPEYNTRVMTIEFDINGTMLNKTLVDQTIASMLEEQKLYLKTSRRSE